MSLWTRATTAWRSGQGWLGDRFSGLTLGATLVWIAPALLLPLGLLVGYSFVTQSYLTGHFSVGWTLENWQQVWDPVVWSALRRSLEIATITTILCAVLGYPLAYFVARHAGRFKNIALVAIIVPFWVRFVIRAYAWLDLLSPNGIVDRLAAWMHVPLGNVQLVNNSVGITIGMVYGYLPLMVLPLYAALERIDERILEAGRDLGATSWTLFWRVTFPQAAPGLIAGCVIVWIPALGEYVIPEILGGGKTYLIGNVIAVDFSRFTWPTGAALSVALVVFALLLVMLAAALLGRKRLSRALSSSFAR